MPKKRNKGVMSQEARRKISEAVRAAAAKKREERERAEARSAPPAKKKRSLDIVKMKDQSFDPALFVPMSTGREIDHFFSVGGGVPKATNYIVVGDPGVGKSTVSMDILADLNERGYKCLFISAEMTRIDLYGYVKRYPKFGDIPTLFLAEYLDDNPKDVIEELLTTGYDVVLVDSFAEVSEAVREINKFTSNAAEKWLIDTMITNNLGNNKGKKHTTFLCIQQVTKGGVFVGSNKLKHNTTGMMELRFDPDLDDVRYIFFSKNRRGAVNKKLFFSLSNGCDVEYHSRESRSNESSIDLRTIDF